MVFWTGRREEKLQIQNIVVIEGKRRKQAQNIQENWRKADENTYKQLKALPASCLLAFIAHVCSSRSECLGVVCMLLLTIQVAELNSPILVTGMGGGGGGKCQMVGPGFLLQLTGAMLYLNSYVRLSVAELLQRTSRLLAANC